MDKVKAFECYSYNRNWFLIDLLLDESSDQIDWNGFMVPNAELDEDNWQCPYMEQYLSEDGTEKVCETYEEPDPSVQPCRIVFFIYKDGSEILRTPHGEFALKETNKMPKAYKKLVEFEDMD